MSNPDRSKFNLPFVTILVGLLVAGLATAGWFLRPQEVIPRASQALEGTRVVDVKKKELNGVSILAEPTRAGTHSVKVTLG